MGSDQNPIGKKPRWCEFHTLRQLVDVAVAVLGSEPHYIDHVTSAQVRTAADRWPPRRNEECEAWCSRIVREWVAEAKLGVLDEGRMHVPSAESESGMTAADFSSEEGGELCT